MDKVWCDLQKFPQELGHGSTVNLQEADSAQRQETNEEMNLEDFLIMSGVVWCGAHYRSPSLQHSCVQNNNNTVLGSGHLVVWLGLSLFQEGVEFCQLISHCRKEASKMQHQLQLQENLVDTNH